MGNSSSYNKEQCQELSGNLYTEELWNEFSNNGEITRQILYVIKNSLIQKKLLQVVVHIKLYLIKS